MPASMKAKLRGHHLICLNFFRGEGYSDDFIKNIYSVVGKEKVEIVEGADDVCSRCPYLKENKCSNNEYTDEKILLQDKAALKLPSDANPARVLIGRPFLPDYRRL